MSKRFQSRNTTFCRLLASRENDRQTLVLSNRPLVAAYPSVGLGHYRCAQEMAAARARDRQYAQLDQPTCLALATSNLAATPLLEVHRILVRALRPFGRHFHYLQRMTHKLENDPNFAPGQPPNPISPDPLTTGPSNLNPQTKVSSSPQTGDGSTLTESPERDWRMTSKGGVK